MNPSERIKAITSTAKVLSSEEWSIIDLTLTQFGFPTSDQFRGNKFDYALEHIKKGDDKKIFEIASHFDLAPSEPGTEVTPSFWRDGFFRLFISHLASDKSNAHTLKEKLESFAIAGFVAHTDIEPTKEWQDEIELALRTADALAALMIKGFHESKWTDQEIGLALGRDLLIIPVRMGQDPYGFIGKFQAIGFSEVDKLSEEIFHSLIKNKKTGYKMAQAIVTKFENSGSFASSKSNISLLEEIEYWDEKLIDRLKTAADNNSQISHSFGVPARINRLIEAIEIRKFGN